MTIRKTVSLAAAVCLAAAPAVQAQIDVAEGPGSQFTYVYNPLTAGALPDVIAEPSGHSPLSYVNEGSTAFLHSNPWTTASATWHYRLTDPDAIWANDAWIRGGVLLINDAGWDLDNNYWTYEFSSDGETFFPFFSTRSSDAGQPYHWAFTGAHSGSGAISLARGGYEGGGQDLYIRLTAVSNNSEGVWMQALRTEPSANRQFELTASVVHAADAGAMVNVSLQTATSLNQSTSDSLNGNVGELNAPLHFTSGGGAESFTNAVSASSPGGNVFWHPDNAAYSITWDLAEEGAAERQLDRFSVWLSGDDSGRKNYHGSISVSTDGFTFVDVPGGHYANILPHVSGSFNNVDYQFSPGRVVGFRYLRFTSHGLAVGNSDEGTTYWQPRFVEIDVFVSAGTPGEGGFADWQMERFDAGELADDSISGADADPDSDGIANLFEYALGLDPKAASRGGLPVVGLENVGGDDYLTLSFRRPNAIADIDYVVTLSGDLGSWAAGAVAAGQTDQGDGTTTYTFRDSQPISEQERRFMRLQVTRAQ